MAQASISAKIKGDATDFKAALTESQTAAQNWARRMAATRAKVAQDFTSRGAAGGGGFMGGMFSGAALARVAGELAVVTAGVVGLDKAMKFGESLRDLEDGLEGVSEDVESVAVQMEKLQDISRNAGVDFFQAGNASKALRAIGYTAEQTRAIIVALGNAIAKTGEGDEALATIVTTLTKISDKGEISEKQFLSLVQTSAAVREAFKKMGIESAQDLEKLGTDTQQIISGLITELQKIPTVTADAADQERWSANIRKLRAQQMSKAAQDVSTPGMSDTSGTSDAARRLKITGPPVDAAAAEQRRLKNLRLAERELSLEAQIAQLEREGKPQYALALRTELALLQQTDKVMKDLNVTRDEAEQFIRNSIQLKEQEFNVDQKKAALDKATAAEKEAAQEKAKEKEGRIRTLDQDPDARNERRFNRNRSLKKQYGTYEKYLQRDPEPGSMSMEPAWKKQFSNLDAFDKFKSDKDWGKVLPPAEREKKAREERLEKEKGAESPELKAYKEATAAFKAAVAAMTPTGDKAKSEPVARE